MLTLCYCTVTKPLKWFLRSLKVFAVVNQPPYKIVDHSTDKSLSEALLFAEHGENMLCTKFVLNVRNNFCTHHVLSLEFSCTELVIQ